MTPFLKQGTLSIWGAQNLQSLYWPARLVYQSLAFVQKLRKFLLLLLTFFQHVRHTLKQVLPAFLRSHGASLNLFIERHTQVAQGLQPLLFCLLLLAQKFFKRRPLLHLFFQLRKLMLSFLPSFLKARQEFSGFFGHIQPLPTATPPKQRQKSGPPRTRTGTRCQPQRILSPPRLPIPTESLSKQHCTIVPWALLV